MGIREIHISQPSWQLDKVIDLQKEGNPLEYELKYSFAIPAVDENQEVELNITAISIGGNKTVFTQKVSVLSKEAEEAPKPQMYIVGYGFLDYSQNWNPAEGILMTEKEAGVYTKTKLKLEEDAKIKFLGQKNWTPDNFGWKTEGTDATAEMINDKDSEALTIVEAGIYDVEFNKNNLTCTLKKVADLDLEDTMPAEMYIVGNGFTEYDQNWNPNNAIPMKELEEGIYTKVSLGLGVNSQIKFIGQKSWKPNNYGWVIKGTDAAAKMINSDKSEALQILEAGVYTIVFNKNNLTCTVTKEGEIEEPEEPTFTEMFLIGGGFIDYDQNWDPAKGIPMQLSEEGAFILSEVKLEAGAKFKFLGQKGWNPNNFGWKTEGTDASAEMMNHKDSEALLIELAGIYNISFEPKNMACVVTKVGDLEVEPEEPEVPVLTEMFLIGGGFVDYASSWEDLSLAIQMQTSQAGIFTFASLKLEAGAKFKFLGQKEWTPNNFGWKTEGTDATAEMINDKNAHPLKIEQAGIYDLTFNAITLTCTVTKVGDLEVEPEEPEVPALTSMYMIGDGFVDYGKSWDNPIYTFAMSMTEAGVFTKTNLKLKAGAKFKFLPQQSWKPHNFGWVTEGTDATAPMVDSQESESLTVPQAGIYTIVFNSNTLACTVTKTAELDPAESETPAMYIVGNGFVHYNQNYNTNNVIPMTQFEKGVFTKANIHLKANAQIKFVGQKGWNPKNYGWKIKGNTDASAEIINGSSSQALVIVEAGIYTIVFDENNLTCTIDKVTDAE